MQIILIPAEYNPFHAGHAWQLAQLRQRYGSRAIIVALMSGNFCQRGLPALAPAQERAKVALAAGLDLVLELPLPWAISSADYFAQGIVDIMAETGLRYTLACSAETADVALLRAWALLRLEGSESYHSQIRAGQSQGLAYAAAEAQAAAQILGTDPAVLGGSNNQLAAAYLAAITKRHGGNSKSAPDCCLLQRQGQAYLDQAYKPEDLEGAALLSARAIRQALADHQADPAQLVQLLQGRIPNSSLASLLHWRQQGLLSSKEHYARLLFARLATASPEELSRYWAWTPDLAQRLAKLSQELLSHSGPAPLSPLLDQLIGRGQTRCFTQSRIQRALLSLVLNLEQGQARELLAQPPAYTRLLAHNKNGRYLLGQLRKRSSIPVLTRASDRQYAKQGPALDQLWQLEQRAAQLSGLLQEGPAAQASGTPNLAQELAQGLGEQSF